MLRRRRPPVLTGLPGQDEAGRPLRVVLLGRAGCHLCEEAREVVRRVCDATGTGWVERDLDRVPELLARYATLVPVVLVDGREHAHWRVDPARLTEALRR